MSVELSRNYELARNNQKNLVAKLGGPQYDQILKSHELFDFFTIQKIEGWNPTTCVVVPEPEERNDIFEVNYTVIRPEEPMSIFEGSEYVTICDYDQIDGLLRMYFMAGNQEFGCLLQPEIGVFDNPLFFNVLLTSK
tara:strand:+ start:241 stop:651 length:411 start_codon:yes stop_codon:yes gene_type:complete